LLQSGKESGVHLSIGETQKSKLIEEVKPEKMQPKKTEVDSFKQNLQKAFQSQNKSNKGQDLNLRRFLFWCYVISSTCHFVNQHNIAFGGRMEQSRL